MIEEFFKSGQVAFLIVAVMLLEALFRPLFHNAFGHALGAGAGACLVLALRAALTAAVLDQLIGLFLALSFVFHIMEVRQWLRLAKRLPQ